MFFGVVFVFLYKLHGYGHLLFSVRFRFEIVDPLSAEI